MRWTPHPPAHPYVPPWWMWLLVPVWGPVVALLAVALGILWCKRKVMGPSEQWRPWFAWFPITVEPTWDSQQRVWFEWVERRSGHLMSDASHRLPPDAARSTEKGE